MFVRACKFVVAIALVLAIGGLLLSSFTAPASASALAAKHPKIRTALADLRDAREELKSADTDFGGHKKLAISSVDDAIEQLQKCIDND